MARAIDHHSLHINTWQTALHWAAKHGKEDMATLVVKAGADVNTKSHVSGCPFVFLITALKTGSGVVQYSMFSCGHHRPFEPLKGPKAGCPSQGRMPQGWGYTPLHIAALHGHQHMVELLVQTYGAKKNLRDYSGHLASQYLTDRDPDEPGQESETQLQAAQARERGRNRKLPSLFLSKKKWGSAEELAPIEEERSTPPQPLLPAYRPRKFSR
ncbi:unnamed protein product [Arctogadus glacialis]